MCTFYVGLVLSQSLLRHAHQTTQVVDVTILGSTLTLLCLELISSECKYLRGLGVKYGYLKLFKGK